MSMNETWCPKLQLCYEEACDEANVTPLQGYNDYAIYPKYIVDYVQSCDKQKTIDFCFLGAFSFRRGQSIGYDNRSWIIDFAKKHFTEKSIFVNTTKHRNLGRNWVPLGIYDKTFDAVTTFTAPKYMANKNHFDKNYYNTMCKAKYALCPAGDLMWSMRFYEALLCKCIPIVKYKEETYRNTLEKNIQYKFYYHDQVEDFTYNESWVNHNYELFMKYHTFLTPP